MKYLQVTEREGRYISELREAAVPQPRADEVLVRVAASGLNRADLSQIAGRYPPPPGEPEILGLEVAGTLPGSDERARARRAGGRHAQQGGAPTIEQRWGPDSVTVVLDPIGAATLPGDLTVLAPGGRIITIGTLGGASAHLDLSLVMRKRARLIGSTLRARRRAEKAALVAQFRRDILPAFDGGALRVTLDSVFPPAEAVAAFQRMRDNANTG